MSKLFVFGFGFAGAALARRLGWPTVATARSAEQAQALTAQGIEVVNPTDTEALAAALADVSAILVTAPPGPEGCPGLNALVPALARANAFPEWIGYLSTTGVYGDRGGRWCFEGDPVAASSPEGARRAAAERDWMQVGRGMGLTVQAFRLPSIYGPGRSALDRLRGGMATNPVKPGQVFGRIHVDDLAAGLEASIRRPRPGARYNLTDDEPAEPQAVIAHAARLLGVSPPPEAPVDLAALAPAARRFWTESRRISNARAKAELDWRPAYPSYREGLAAILAAGG